MIIIANIKKSIRVKASRPLVYIRFRIDFSLRSEIGFGKSKHFGLKWGTGFKVWAAHPDQKRWGVPPPRG